MLKEITIKGFKSIRELHLKLNALNVLIGSNGVGKSNFISFFKLINTIYEQRLEQYSLKSGVDNLLHYGRKTTSYTGGRLVFEAFNYLFVLEATDNDTLFVSHQQLSDDSTLQMFPLQASNKKGSDIKQSPQIKNNHLKEYLESYKVYHFQDTGISSPLRSRANINDNRMLREDGSNLPAYLYYFQEKHPKTFKRIEKTIQSVAPFFDQFDLKPAALDEEQILLEWKEKEHQETYFNANHLSDGTLRFIALTTLLMQPNLPKMVIIDEPELGLHPAAISKLSGIMRSAAGRGCQIIVSTQSVTLLDNFTAEDIITVDRENNQSEFKRLDKEALSQWMEDYSIGELWEKSVIKGQPL